MNTVPSDTVKKTRTDELFFIDPEFEIELNPEKKISAADAVFYTAPSGIGTGNAPNDTTWD